MNELVKKWIEALRSGEYTQSIGRLSDGRGGFCCLGVLCDIVNPDGWTEIPSYGMPPDDEPQTAYRGSNPHETLGTGLAPTSVWRGQAGLGDVLNQSTLANMNDNGFSFKEIADYIEGRINAS